MINRISRDMSYSKSQFLWFLMNKLGYDVQIAYNYKKDDGTIMFSKWKSFMWLLEQEPDKYNTELRCTRQKFIEKATHRSVLDIEIMIDIDEKGEFNSIKEQAINIVNKLKEKNISYTCCFSGSKSYHISILIPQLRGFSDYERTRIKHNFLKMVDSDLLKASCRNMIAMEGEPHWKTGKIKREVLL